MQKLGKVYCRKGTSTYFAKVDGKAVQLGKKGATQEEVNQAYETLRLKVAAQNGESQQTIDAQKTSTFIRLYLEAAQKELHPKTLAYKRRLITDFQTKQGETPIRAITPLAVREWVEGHAQWNATSQNIAYKVLAAFFHRCREWGLDYNPVSLVLNKPTAQTKGENILVPPAEYLAVLDACKQPWRDIFELLHQLGARPSEVLSLTAAEIDFTHNEIDKVHHKTIHKGKKRLILLTRRAVNILQGVVAKRPTGLLFTTQSGGPITPSHLSGHLKKVKDRLGLTSRWTPYSYRHSFAVYHLDRLDDIYTVATFMGNTVATLELNYAKAVQHARRKHHLLNGD
jgi:integrase